MRSILRGSTGKWIRKVFLFLMDMLFVCVSLYIATEMRYDGAVSASAWKRNLRALPLILLVYAAFSLAGHVYDMIWRYASGREALRLSIVYALSCAMTLLLSRLLQWRISRPILGMTPILLLLIVILARSAWRWFYEMLLRRQGDARKARILIVGAGEGGAYALHICQQSLANFGIPVAFADDDPLKRNMRLGGVPVCGTVAEVPKLVKEKAIDEIIVATPGTHGERLAEIISICKSTRCRTRILTDPNDVDQTKAQLTLRELNTSDFLSRAEVTLDTEQIRGYLADQVVLVTGGGGSIGGEICRQIMRFHPRQLLIFDIYENCAYELENELKQKYGQDCPVTVLIGSIRDKRRLDDVFEAYKPSVVFHAAAHKHVPLMEVCPGEAVKNNIFGTRNLLQSASEHGVERFVQLSTDKAVNPTNVMGATKRVTEMLIQSYARHTPMKCMAVRFGNVLGSHGSVIPLFEAQIRQGGPVTLTHPDITRYFMTIPEAAQLVLQAGGMADSGAIYLLDMGEPVKIIDLARQLMRFYGYEPGVDMEIQTIGLRPGEKLHEELLMDKESAGVTRTAHDKIFVTPPTQFDESEFEAQLGRLSAAVESGGDQAVVDSLVEITKTYRPSRDALAG